MWFKRQSLNNGPLWLLLVSFSVNLARRKEAGPTQREPTFWELYKIDSWGSWYKCLQPFLPFRTQVMDSLIPGGWTPSRIRPLSEAPAGREQCLSNAQIWNPKGLREKLLWAVLEGDVCSRGRLRSSVLVISYFHFSASVKRREYSFFLYFFKQVHFIFYIYIFIT